MVSPSQKIALHKEEEACVPAEECENESRKSTKQRKKLLIPHQLSRHLITIKVVN